MSLKGCVQHEGEIDDNNLGVGVKEGCFFTFVIVASSCVDMEWVY
jgi:hypothetical protein